MTDTGSQVASYSSRGIRGHSHGRHVWAVQAGRGWRRGRLLFTRSEQWDELRYYNPTNTSFDEFKQRVPGNQRESIIYKLSIFRKRLVGVVIQIAPKQSFAGAVSHEPGGFLCSLK